MADSIPPATALAVDEPERSSAMQRFLRRARGQTIDSKVNGAKVSPSTTVETKQGSIDGSQSLGETFQLHSDTYAEGGLTKFYEPIPEYEGRHRWDPNAEWSEVEEKKLIRKVGSLIRPYSLRTICPAVPCAWLTGIA